MVRIDKQLSSDEVIVAKTNGVDTDRIEILIRDLLTAIGEDPTREGLVDTPKRIAKFWAEFIDYEPGNFNTTFSSMEVDQLVVVDGLEGWSLCEHHLMPFSFTAHVGYITGEKVVGLSKIPRIVHMHASKLQIQEKLTHQIAKTVEDITKARGVAVLIEGQHSCMQMRGIKTNGRMVTSCLRGVMLANPAAKQEFLSIIKLGD